MTRSLHGLLWEELTTEERQILMDLLRRCGPIVVSPHPYDSNKTRRGRVAEGSMEKSRIVGIDVIYQRVDNPTPEGKCPTGEHDFSCCVICNHAFPGKCDHAEQHGLL